MRDREGDRVGSVWQELHYIAIHDSESQETTLCTGYSHCVMVFVTTSDTGAFLLLLLLPPSPVLTPSSSYHSPTRGWVGG